MTIADLGTGTGCLLAALLANRPQLRGVGVEASPQAASLARENLSRLGMEDRASVFEGSWADWQDWHAAGLIISNPPYVPAGEQPELQPEVRDWEPRLALFVPDTDPLRFYRALAGHAEALLRPGGWLAAETHADWGAATRDLFADFGLTHTEILPDLAGRDRIAVGQQP